MLLRSLSTRWTRPLVPGAPPLPSLSCPRADTLELRRGGAGCGGSGLLCLPLFVTGRDFLLQRYPEVNTNLPRGGAAQTWTMCED
jgi:hypothetical protein